MSQKRIDVSRIAKTAIFSALSFVLYMYAKFPLPIFRFSGATFSRTSLIASSC